MACRRKCSATTAPCLPAGSSSPARLRCCSSGSAARTASPSGSRNQPRRQPRGRSSGCISPCRTSFSTTAARSRASRRCRPPWTPWRQEYNTDRPHQSLGMVFPASRFTTAQVSPLELRVPARQGLTRPYEPGMTTTAREPAAALRATTEPSLVALEADRIIPPSGNLWIGGQQVWLGPALAGRQITMWVDDNAAGLVGLAGAQVNVGFELAGQRVTLRMDGTQMTVISHDGALLRTLPCRCHNASGTACAAPAGLPASARLRLLGRSQCSGGARTAAPTSSPPP